MYEQPTYVCIELCTNGTRFERGIDKLSNSVDQDNACRFTAGGQRDSRPIYRPTY
jgi:hypothetical protein